MKSLGPRDMLRFLDLVALCVYKYTTCFPILKAYAPGRKSELNKTHKYEQYLMSDKGELVEKTRLNKTTGMPQKPPLQITNPEFRIQQIKYDEYYDIIKTDIFKIRLSKGYWLQEILKYLSDIHNFDLFELLNVRKLRNYHGYYYKGMCDTWSYDSQKTTKLESRLKHAIAR